MSVVNFRERLYTAKQFTAQVDGRTWKFSGTLCGSVDIATPAGTFCLTPDEIISVVASLHAAREDVLHNSDPGNDPRII